MSELKQGDRVLVYANIEACRTGYKKKQYRIKINDDTIWIDENDIVRQGMEEIKE